MYKRNRLNPGRDGIRPPIKIGIQSCIRYLLRFNLTSFGGVFLHLSDTPFSNAKGLLLLHEHQDQSIKFSKVPPLPALAVGGYTNIKLVRGK
jgi:hypothetical protein